MKKLLSMAAAMAMVFTVMTMVAAPPAEAQAEPIDKIIQVGSFTINCSQDLDGFFAVFCGAAELDGAGSGHGVDVNTCADWRAKGRNVGCSHGYNRRTAHLYS